MRIVLIALIIILVIRLIRFNPLFEIILLIRVICGRCCNPFNLF